MTSPVSFNSYLGWVNVTDPANIPADVRIIGAGDLLRYEQFGDAAEVAINELITTTATQTTDITQLKADRTTQGNTLTTQGNTITTQGNTIASHTQDIANLNTALGGITGLTGAKVSASKAMDLTVAGGVKNLATITAGSAYTSFEVELTAVGRNSAGPVYVKAVRYVRPENGAAVYTPIGTDTVLGTIGVSFTPNGAAGTNITATATTSDALLSVHVEVRAGAGATTDAARTVTLAMA